MLFAARRRVLHHSIRRKRAERVAEHASSGTRHTVCWCACEAGTAAVFVSMLTDGLWRVLATVVSVMLPPMAIFFPLFTLLEDVGYLPRVAFQLDHAFQCARASGKQSLTMCMGFRVQRLRRHRLPHHRLAARAADCHPHQQLFAPCNGRFPLLIFLCSVFFAGSAAGGALLLTGVIAASVGLTLLVSRILGNGFARRGGVVCARTAAVPHAADWARYRAQRARPDAVRLREPPPWRLRRACSSGFCQCADREYSYPVAHHGIF